MGQPRFPGAAFDVVVVAASSGGLQALSQLVHALPQNFPIPLMVVQHIQRHRPSLLAGILDQRTLLNVKQAAAGEMLRSGTIYIAPPDRHLLVLSCGMLTLSSSALVNFVRPSADRLFVSAAKSFQHRAIGVVLTGKGHDGAAGILAVKQQGGVTIAQDQATSESFNMPHTAILTHAVDYILPLEAIAPALIDLATKPPPTVTSF